AALHLPDPPPDLALAGAMAFDEQPLAARDRGFEIARHEPGASALALDPLEAAGGKAAVIAASPLYQALITDPREEAGARAGEVRLEGVAPELAKRALAISGLAGLALAGLALPERDRDRTAIERGRRPDVVGALEPALDLQRR